MSGLLGPLGGGGGGHRRLLSTSSYSSPPKKVLWLRESVYYLTLNHSSPRATRLFSQRLAQVCSYAEGEYSCLPHYDTQPNSGKNIVVIFYDLLWPQPVSNLTSDEHAINFFARTTFSFP